MPSDRALTGLVRRLVTSAALIRTPVAARKKTSAALSKNSEKQAVKNSHPLKFHVHYDHPELYRKLVGDNPVEQDDAQQMTC